MAAVRAAARRRAGLGAVGLRAFWGGRSLEAVSVLVPAERRKGKWKQNGAVPEKEERSDPSLICPLPCSRSYIPPEDLQSCLESHVREVFGPSLPEDWQQTPLQENRLKHCLLAQLAAELGHAVPNSQLQQMCCAGDMLGFCCTPMKDGIKINELVAAELPPNLKIIWQQ